MSQARHPPTGGGPGLAPPTEAEEQYYEMREGDPSIAGIIQGFETEGGNNYPYLLQKISTCIHFKPPISQVHVPKGH